MGLPWSLDDLGLDGLVGSLTGKDLNLASKVLSLHLFGEFFCMRSKPSGWLLISPLIFDLEAQTRGAEFEV
jgi:hypothetical protein